MDRLERLREELNSMEEAQEKGELNQNEQEYLIKLREEVKRTEEELLEEEINNALTSDKWYQEHLLEQKELQNKLELLESQYELKKADMQRNGRMYDPDLEEIEKKISTVSYDLNLLSNDLNKRREKIKEELLNKYEKADEEVADTVINDITEQEQKELEEVNNTEVSNNNSVDILMNQKIEELFMQDEWVRSHVVEEKELERNLELVETQYFLKEAEMKRNGQLFNSDLENIAKKRNKIIEDINLLNEDFDRKRNSIRERLESEVERQVTILYNNDSWVIDHLLEQKGLTAELESLNTQRSLKESEMRRNGMMYNSDLEEIDKKISKINSDLALLENDFLRRREYFKRTVLESNDIINNITNKNDINNKEIKEDLENHVGTLPPSSEETVGILPPSSEETVGTLPPSSEETVGLLPPNSEKTVGALPPSSEETVGLLPPSSEETVGLLPPSMEEVVGLLPPASDLENIDKNNQNKSNNTNPNPDITPNPSTIDSNKEEENNSNRITPPPVGPTVPNPSPIEPNKEEENNPNRITPLPVEPTVSNPERVNPQVIEPDRSTPTKPRTPEKSDGHKKRSLETILYGLISGDELIGLKNSDYRHFQGRNIEITPERIKQQIFGDGPRAYKLSHAPKIVTHAMTGVAVLGRKISGTLLSTEESRRKIAIIQERLNNLSREDLMTLGEEYLGSQIVQAKMPSFIDSMIREKITSFNQEVIAKLNTELEDIINKLYLKESVVSQIKEKQSAGEITSEEATRRIQKASVGSAELIKLYRKKNQQLLHLTSRGIEEDIRAAHTGMNLEGRKGAKDNREITPELQSAWSETSKMEQQMLDNVVDGNDIKALDDFINYKNAIERHTAYNDSLLFGKRSVGLREATPIVRQLDYREDPLLRDLTSSVMQITAIANIANSISTELQRQEMIKQHNDSIAQHNADLDATQRTIHSKGEQLSGHADAYGRGMQATSMQRMEAQNTTHERVDLDMHSDHETGWAASLRNPAYTQRDNDINHVFDGRVYQELSSRFQQAGSELSSGNLSPDEYLKQISEISSNFVRTSQVEFESAYEVALKYIQENPQFDLTAYQGSLNYTISHMQDFIDMNQAMVESVDIGRILESLPIEHAEALGKLPNSILSNIITSTVLMKAASHVAQDTSDVVKKVNESKTKDTIVESVGKRDKEQLINEAERRYYNLSKVKKVFSRLKWRQIQELKQMNTDLSIDDVETIKGAFR